MFKPVYDKLEKEVSGATALNYVAEIAKHHRIQASPGIRAACKYAINELKKQGIEARLHSYPANGKDYDWTSLRFQEWNCNDAWLKITEPSKYTKYIARFSDEKIHVLQRSKATPPEGLTAEIVVPPNKGEEVEDYEGLDVKGKFVVTNGEIHRVKKLACEERGAVGIIFDGMFVRPPNLLEGELDDSLKYTSFWYNEGDEPGLGWVITPRTGRWLRKLVKESKDPIKAHGFIDAELYDGALDNAVATIPGETDEEVIIIGHICHPQPSANDNASGAGAVMEVARALHTLIKNGELAKPKRTIMFTLVPEMSGTYAYLAEREQDIPKMVAAINLDMVGEDQNKTGSTLVVHKTPDSFPSYVNAVTEAIFDATKEEFASIGGSPMLASFRHKVGDFSSGSDHYIYTDPTVGIPCPMIIQWPDKFYHTSADSIDKVSPDSLRIVAHLTATYAYFLANAGDKEAAWIGSQVATRERHDLLTHVQKTLDKAMTLTDPDKLAEINHKLAKKIKYDIERGKEAVQSTLRICPNSKPLLDNICNELEKSGKAVTERASKSIHDYATGIGVTIPEYKPEKKAIPKGAEIIPEKLYRGPLSSRPWMAKLSDEDKEALRKLNKKHGVTYGGPSGLALYWTDGKRSLYEISELIDSEVGSSNLDYLVEYYPFLVKLGLVKDNNR